MSKTSQILRLGGALAACLCSTACVQGELQNVGVELDPLVDPLYEFQSGNRIIAGSRVCPEFVWWAGPTGEGMYLEDEQQRDDLRACYDETLEGAAFVEGCLLLDEVGEASWKLDADAGCSLGPVESDLFRFDVVMAGESLRLGFDDWQARGFAGNLLWGTELEPIGLAPGAEAADLLSPSNEPRRVFAGEDVPISLRLDDEQGQVFWAAQDDVFELVGEGLEFVEGDDQDQPEYPGEVVVRVEEGAVGLIRAEVSADVQRESPSVIGVAKDEAASLDLIAVANAEGQPVAARAVVRDEQGRILHGAPIEWDVTYGALAVMPGQRDNMARSRDYALIDVACEAPPMVPTQRRATLQAELGELSDSVQLEWTAEPDLDAGFEPNPNCMFAEDDGDDEDGDGDGGGADEGELKEDDGCQCSAEGGGAAGMLGMLGVLGMLVIRRRRQ